MSSTEDFKNHISNFLYGRSTDETATAAPDTLPPVPELPETKIKYAIQICRWLIFPDCYGHPPASPCTPDVTPSLELALARLRNNLKEAIVSGLLLEHWESRRELLLLGRGSNSRTSTSGGPSSNLETSKETKPDFSGVWMTPQCPFHGPSNEGHTVNYSSEFCLGHGIENAMKRPYQIPPSWAIDRGEDDEGKVMMEDLGKRVSAEIVEPFLQALLKELFPLLRSDVEAVLEKDVATKSKAEVILCYPGITCLLHQRIAHKLLRLGAPMVLARYITERAHSATGIDIHPATQIGRSMFIDHGTGIVIGATAQIGNNVSLYQGVVLGAKSFKRDAKTGERMKHLLRHPVVEDGVTIYSGASVLGRVTVGRGATIGGSVSVMNDVAPKDVVLQGKPTVTSTTQGTPLAGQYELEHGAGI